MPESPVNLVVLLIRPTRYDDDGYVVRHWRGTLPSNTLSCLNGLTQEAIERGVLHPIAVEVHTFDEAVDRVDATRLARRFRRRNTTVLVALAGVQTNQFPRAQDLARAFKAEGCTVMIGGFHVSGSVALAKTMPPECQAMIDEGVTLVFGEVEERWADLLHDAAYGRLRRIYNFLNDHPSLTTTPLPRASLRLQRKFAVRGYGTIDAGRGCPFNCSFCTIVNVQGRTMRSRGAAAIVDHVRRHYVIGHRPGLRHYFFTDDNFSRNPEWRAILDGLIALRRDEGLAVDFMMQVDTAASRIPGFVDAAAAAGCVQVFIGMESLREDNLRAAGKRQNRVALYRDSIARWHEAGILCHVGFIIGFPHDTYDRIVEDVRMLRDELRVDQASFFMLTPLPGSLDHRAAVDARVPLDPDFNNYDSFHPTRSHPLMSADAWQAAYDRAWREFYSFDHMRQALLRQNPHTYWGMLKCFLWYRAAMLEGSHPMVTGFFRLKDRRSRRPGLPIEGRFRFYSRRMRDTARITAGYARLLVEMRELWLATRIRRNDYRFAADLRRLRTQVTARLDLKTNWSKLHASMRARLQDARPPFDRIVTARIAALARATGVDTTSESPAGSRLHVAALVAAVEARRSAYWAEIGRRLRRGQVWRVNPFRLAWNAMGDVRRTLLFVFTMASERY